MTNIMRYQILAIFKVNNINKIVTCPWVGGNILSLTERHYTKKETASTLTRR